MPDYLFWNFLSCGGQVFDKMDSFGDTLVLLFIIILLYVLVRFFVSRFLRSGSLFTGGYAGNGRRLRQKFGSDDPKEGENEPKCSCVEKCDCEKNHLLLHYKKIAERNPEAEGKIIVQLHATEWCEFCKKMKPIWEEMILRIKNDPKTAERFLFLEQDQDECNSPGIKKVPSIYKFDQGENSLVKYENVYDVDNLYNWVLNG